MKAASIKQLRTEIGNLPPHKLAALTERLIKYKKDNKELASYIIFYEEDEAGFADDVETALEEQFGLINFKTAFFAKKGLRKMIRIANKFLRYTPNKSTQARIIMDVLSRLALIPASLKKNTQIKNMQVSLLKKLDDILLQVHQDERHDFEKQLKEKKYQY